MKKYRKIALQLEIGGALILFIPFIAMFFIPQTEKYQVLFSHADVILFSAIILFFILEIISFIISFIFWRCEYCNQRFPLRWGPMDKANRCPFCGNKLE